MLYSPLDTGGTLTYTRRLGNVQDIFWMYYNRSIYVLCPGGRSMYLLLEIVFAELQLCVYVFQSFPGLLKSMINIVYD